MTSDKKRAAYVKSGGMGWVWRSGWVGGWGEREVTEGVAFDRKLVTLDGESGVCDGCRNDDEIPREITRRIRSIRLRF